MSAASHQRLADAVYAAESALNEAAKKALRAGLRVEMKTRKYHDLVAGLVSCTVHLPLVASVDPGEVA